MASERQHARALLVLLAALALLVAACAEDDPEETADEQPPAGEDDVDTDAAADGPEINLNVGHPFPDDHPMAENIIRPWADEVEEGTGGTVTVDIHPGGALADADALYENTAAGAIEGGMALQGYTPGRFPLTQIVELPFLFESGVETTEALWDLYEEFPEFQAEYDDTKVIALWGQDLGDLFTVDDPVIEPGDVEGLTLRAPGPLQNVQIEELGGSAVSMPAGELYDSLEQGVIDGLLIANSGVRSFSLYEVLEHANIGGHYVAAMFFTISLDAYEQMSPEQQQVVDEASGRELSLQGAEAYDAIQADLQPEFEELGLEVHELSDDEVEEWRAATAPVVDEWLATAEAEGAPAEEMYERLQEIVGAE